MKGSLSKISKGFSVLFFGLILQFSAFAQDLDVDVDLDGNDASSLFSNPVFWIGVGVVVIIVAIIMSRSKK